MRKVFALVVILAFLTSCTSFEGAEDDVFEITERFFAMQMFEVFIDSENFLGRTIRYEGMFTTLQWDDTGQDFHLVYRYTEGCCMPEEALGLEVYLNNIEPLPDGAWVEVIGVLERFNEGGQSFLRLDVVSLIEKDERGMELVPSL